MLMNVFRSEYEQSVKKANWEFYEPYTEHGSSLSACAYGIVAAGIGKQDWAYKYFMKTASVDLTGDTKQYLGSLYIGGTHPAANGGAWNTAIFGFAGVSFTDDTLDISPRLPENWESLSFKLNWKGEKLNIKVTAKGVKIEGVKNSNVTVESFEFASWCLEKGINLPKIYKQSMLTMSRTKFEAEKLSMNRLEFLADGKIAFTYLTKSDCEEIGVKSGERDGIVEIGKAIEGVEVSIFLYEKEKGFKASLRSNEYVNVSDVCSVFGGGGHIKAAGATLNMTFEEAKKAIVSEVIKNLK